MQELQCTHRGLAAALQFVAVLGPGEQPLVLAQGVFDLGVAGQGGIVVDAEPAGGLQLGLVVVADAAFGHQAGGFVGEAVAPLAGLAGSMLTGAMHAMTPVATWVQSSAGM